MISLIIARHGNTFEAPTVPYFVGQTIDLPLTQQGQAQIHAMGAYCHALPTMPKKIYCGPLLRHQQTAQIIQHYIHSPIEISEALNELAFGLWEGLTESQIKQRWPQQFQGWTEEGRWPTDCFTETARDNWTNLKQLLIQLTNHQAEQDCVLWVTSQGKIRLLLKFVNNLWDQLARNKTFPSYKVNPGNICRCQWHRTELKIQSWNEKPLLIKP